MNAPRIAALLRELADAIEEEAPANDATPAAPKLKAARRREYPAPLHSPSETDRARARGMLKRRGYGT